MPRGSCRIQRRLTGLLMVALGLAGAGCGATLPTAPLQGFQAELDVARSATARYQDVSVALEDGFMADAVCVSSPAGAMGIHYVSPERMDDRLAAGEPEVLLYIPEGAGLRLVAVEYFLPVLENGPYFGPAAPANSGTAPALFGQPFDGPMEGHNPGMPWHYDLHVWLWAENPAGVFTQFNPQLRCP